MGPLAGVVWCGWTWRRMRLRSLWAPTWPPRDVARLDATSAMMASHKAPDSSSASTPLAVTRRNSAPEPNPASESNLVPGPISAPECKSAPDGGPAPVSCFVPSLARYLDSVPAKEDSSLSLSRPRGSRAASASAANTLRRDTKGQRNGLSASPPCWGRGRLEPPVVCHSILLLAVAHRGSSGLCEALFCVLRLC